MWPQHLASKVHILPTRFHVWRMPVSSWCSLLQNCQLAAGANAFASNNTLHVVCHISKECINMYSSVRFKKIYEQRTCKDRQPQHQSVWVRHILQQTTHFQGGFYTFHLLIGPLCLLGQVLHELLPIFHVPLLPTRQFLAPEEHIAQTYCTGKKHT